MVRSKRLRATSGDVRWLTIRCFLGLLARRFIVRSDPLHHHTAPFSAASWDYTALATIKVLVYKAAHPGPSCSACRQHHLPPTTAILGHWHSRLCNSASLRSMCTLTLRFHFFLLLRFLPHTLTHTHSLSSICVGLCAAFLSRITHMLNVCCEMFQGPFLA